MNNKIVMFVLLLGINFLTPVMAQADKTSSSFSVELGRDNDEGNERYLDLSLGLTGGMQFLASQGVRTTDSINGDLKTDSWSVGLATDASADVGLGVYYSYWDDNDTMKINTLSLDLILNTADWGLIFSPQTRDIKLEGLSQKDTTLNSLGLGVTAEYYGVEDFYFSATHLFYSYSSNVSALENSSIVSRRTFTVTTPDRSSGLEDHRTILEMGYFFAHVMLGAQRSNSVYAADNSHSTIDTLFVSWDATQQWRFKVSAGISAIDGYSEDLRFATMAATYRW